MAQTDLSSLFNVPSPSSADHSSPSNTVSRNQLLSSDKALRGVDRAREFIIRGNIDKAQKEISGALRASPDCAIALDIQAVIHMHVGKMEDAANEFQRAINADPTIGQAYVGLGMLLIGRHQFKDALVPLARAEALLPTSWLVNFETAIAHLQLGNLDAVLKQLKTVERLSTDPDKKSGTAYLQALVSIRNRDYKTATELMKEVISLSPDSSYAKPAEAIIERMKPLLMASENSLAGITPLQQR